MAHVFQDHYGDRSFAELANLFGPSFAQAVLGLTPGSWQGLIESGCGWHLVWVDSITPGRVPAFEEVEPDVKAEWVAEQRAGAKRKAFDAMRARLRGRPASRAKAMTPLRSLLLGGLVLMLAPAPGRYDILWRTPLQSGLGSPSCSSSPTDT